MSQLPPSLSAADLLAHAHFVRAVARGLLGDDESASDLVQDTWVAALHRPPRNKENVRSWLASIARNLVRSAKRAERKRVRREQTAARPEALASASSLVEAMEVHRRIVECVLALAEPYRSTILLRFFAELPPREIARQHAIPVETVRTRLKRALGELRMRLDAQHGGDRVHWCAPLAALMARSTPMSFLTTTLTGVLFMTLKAKIVVALAVIVALTAVLWPPDASIRNRTGRASAPVADREASEADLATAAKAAADLVAEEPARKPLEAPAPPVRWQAHGLVVNEQRGPIAGAHLRVLLHGLVDGSIAEASTDDQGHFDLAIVKPADISDVVASSVWPYLEATATGFAKDGASILTWQAPVDLTIVLKHEDDLRTLIEGRVIDASGQPVAEALVRAHPWPNPGATRERTFGAPMRGWGTKRDGKYSITMTKLGTVAVHASAFGVGVGLHPGVVVNLGDHITLPDLVLRGGAGTIKGHVTYADGSPARDVGIIAGLTTVYDASQAMPFPGLPPPGDVVGLTGMPMGSTATDEHGAFALEALVPGEYFVAAPDQQGKPTPVQVARTDDGEVHLVLYRHRLVLTFVDDLGTRIPSSTAWIRWSDGQVNTPIYRNGQLIRDVAEGKFEVWAKAPASRPAFAAAEIGPDDWETRLDLVLRPLGKPGSIRLVMRDERGDPVRACVAQLTNPFVMRFMANGPRDMGRQFPQFTLRAPMVITDIPPSRYRLQVLPNAMSWDAADDDPFLPLSVAVEVVEDRETLVELNVQRGGQLSILLNGSADLEVVNQRTLSGNPSRHLPRTTILLTPEGGSARELDAGDFHGNRDGRQFSGLSLGLTALAVQRFAPGTYRIKITVEGCTPVEQTVTIRACETTTVEAELQRAG